MFSNRGVEVTYGWLSKEALGRNTYQLLRTKFSEPTDEIEAALLREGQWEGEVIHHKRDGTRLIVASRWTLQRGADGVPVRIRTINNEITHRRQGDAERLLKSMVSRLSFRFRMNNGLQRFITRICQPSKQARNLLHRCLLPDLDVLLPKMSSGAKGECFFCRIFCE